MEDRIAAQEDLVVRELRPEELDALTAVPPFNEVGLGTEDRDTVRVVGAIRDGKIVAYWMLFDTVHVEPLWISPEERGNPALIRQIWEKVRGILDRCGVPIAFAVIGDGALGTNAPMAARLGFKPLAGNLFYLLVDRARELVRGRKES
jgi:hypothetical protein